MAQANSVDSADLVVIGAGKPVQLSLEQTP